MWKMTELHTTRALRLAESQEDLSLLIIVKICPKTGGEKEKGQHQFKYVVKKNLKRQLGFTQQKDVMNGCTG